MKIFPIKNYNIQLIDNPQILLEILKLKTLESDSLSAKSTPKQFIGRINGNHFEIISSETGIGSFTVLRGDFYHDSVSISAEINKPFKFLISIVFFTGIIGIAYNAYKIGFPQAFGLTLPLILFFGLLRYVFVGLFFKKSFTLTFGKFTKLLNITAIQ